MKMNKTQKRELEKLLDKKYITTREFMQLEIAHDNKFIEIIETGENYIVSIYNNEKHTNFI